MTDSGMICMEHRYGTHELQKIAVYRFPEDAQAKFHEASLNNDAGEMKYWFVYVSPSLSPPHTNHPPRHPHSS
jgi:hypothetical protein